MGNNNNNYSYTEAFTIFEEYVSENNKRASENLHIGYLINQKKLYEFKDKIKEQDNIFNSFQSEKITKLNAENPDEVLKQIDEGAKFILINRTLYAKICIENIINPYQIKYRIYQEYINIYITNNVILKVEKNAQNIIEKTKILEKNEIDDKIIEKIHTDIINFYNIEKKFEENLKNINTIEKYYGFLVDNAWVEKWRKYSYYDSIKTKYLQNNIRDKKVITDIIKEEQRKNYYNYNELNDDIEKSTLKDKNEIILKENLDKSFAILDLNFLKQFPFNKRIDQTIFNLNYQTISIVEKTGIIYKSFKTINNIISINNNNFNNLNTSITSNTNNTFSKEYLKHLMRTIFLKKEFLSPESKYKNNLIKENLIKSDIINDLVQKFKLKELMFNLEKNPKINNITYENFDIKFNEILKIINETDSNYFNSIKQYDDPRAINFGPEKRIFTPKCIYNQNKYKYIDNFEIIDDKFTAFLDQTFYKTIDIHKVYFGIKENYILLVINYENDNICEILSFNNMNCAFAVEYLIEFVNIKNIDITQLSNYLLPFLSREEIQNLVSKGTNIKTGNIIFNIHSINNNNILKTNENPNQYNKIYSITVVNGSLKKDKKLKNSTNMSNTCVFDNKLNLKNSSNENTGNILHELNQNDFSVSKSMNANIHNSNINNSINSNAQIQTEQKNLNANPFNNNCDEAIINTNDNIDNNKLNYFLLFAIELIKQRNTLIQIITKSTIKSNDSNKNYYLINKDYITYLKSIFHLKEIKNIMVQSPSNNDEEMLNIINTKLPEGIKNNIKQLHRKNIQQDLDKLSDNNDKNKIVNYDIITKEISIKLNEIDKNIGKKCHNVNCVFDNNKIIILFDKKIIYIANYKEDNIFFENMIESENSELLFNCFKHNGFQFIHPYISYNKINIPFNQNYIIKTKIYKLTPDGQIECSNELKTLILLAYSQNFFDYNKIHKVYLINYKWLKHFKYEEIKSLVDNSLKNKPFTNINDINSASNLIPYLDQEKLKDIDKKLIKIKPDSSKPLNKPEIIAIKDKYFIIYDNFVLVNEQIFSSIQKYYHINQIHYDISFVHKKSEGDLIIMKDYHVNLENIPNYLENIIIFRSFDKKENKYIVSFILDYQNKQILEKELSEHIMNKTFNNYLNERTYFNNQIKYDYISPIFAENQIIGNCYKFKKDFDYKKCVNYLEYLNNQQLMNSIYLYSNKLHLLKKIKTSNPDEEYYLIKKQVIIDMKQENNYENMKQLLKGKINDIQNNREIYFLIKSLPKDYLKQLNNNNKNNMNNIDSSQTQMVLNRRNNNDPTIYEIDTIPINDPYNSSQFYLIGNNIDLIEKNCAHVLFKDINQKPNTKILCSFIGNNMIIIHYLKGVFNNIYDICIISKIDEKFNITNEYFIKYNNTFFYQNHITIIKNDLNKFLASLNLVNNICKIFDSNGNEIGIIIKLTGSSGSPIIIKELKIKPLIGLQNIGATCYMNATLQCLCNIKKLVDYFKYENKDNKDKKDNKENKDNKDNKDNHLKKIIEEDIYNEKLCTSFKLLIDNLYPKDYNGQKSYFAPNDFKEKISKMNPLFEGIAANDAKDLVNFLIMTLHSELNKAKAEDIIENNNVFEDQRNKDLVLKNFAKSFAKSNQSIISDLFYALNYNMNLCSNCQAMTFNYQIYFFLIFPLEEVRKFKLSFNNGFNNFNNNINEVDIMDCFYYDQKINYMMGDNAMYCNYCKQTCNSSMCTKLATGPEILIIILNRGKGIEFNVKINFTVDLNLENFIELQDTGCHYELFGVITHIGESGMGGHFIAYCKEYFNNTWLKFNDAMVDPVTDFKKEVIDFAMPYLLFYKKK